MSENKKVTSKEDLEVKKQLIKEERESLQLLLIQGTEDLIVDKGSDKYLDRLNEKVKLISGVEISLNEIRRVITANLQSHPSQFVLDFYIEIYRLMGWKDRDPSSYIKPKEVADITNEVIYGRFSKDILPTLQQMNYYVGFCVRAHRHYQFLNKDGIAQLSTYIDQAISTMKDCETYYQFRIKMFKEYGVPYQTELFRKN